MLTCIHGNRASDWTRNHIHLTQTVAFSARSTRPTRPLTRNPSITAAHARGSSGVIGGRYSIPFFASTVFPNPFSYPCYDPNVRPFQRLLKGVCFTLCLFPSIMYKTCIKNVSVVLDSPLALYSILLDLALSFADCTGHSRTPVT